MATDPQVIPIDPANPYPLGAHFDFDSRNADHPLVFGLGAPAPPRPAPWPRTVPVFDQGAEGSCVIQAITGCDVTDPLIVDFTALQLSQAEDPSFRTIVYNTARRLDGIEPNADPPTHEGTTLNAGFKAMHTNDLDPGAGSSSGHGDPEREYVWATGVDDLLAHLDSIGPLALAVPWHEQMFNPDPDGTVHIGGQIVGGHAIEVDWHDAGTDAVSGWNSWSASWGANGRWRMTVTDLRSLFAENAQAAAWVTA